MNNLEDERTQLGQLTTEGLYRGDLQVLLGLVQPGGAGFPAELVTRGGHSGEARAGVLL